MKMIAMLVLAAIIFHASPALSDDCLTAYLQRSVIKAIVACKTIRDLRHLRAHEVFRNDVTEAIYSLRMYELQPTTAAEDALIQSVPSSDITLSLLYHLTYLDTEPPAVPQLFIRYLDAVYIVARKSRKRYPALIRLPVLAQGGDLGEAVSDYVKRLYDADPVGVSRVLMTMPEPEAHLVCGEDAVPRP